MKYPKNIREEELKNKVREDFFAQFDCSEIIKDIDFAVRTKHSSILHDEYLFWAEAKVASTDIFVMLAQLVLTIGKARTFDKTLPPLFLGCFDCEKIVFLPYFEIQHIFYKNDFNWKVTPSNHKTEEFKQAVKEIKSIIGDTQSYIFDFEKDEKELKKFIKENFRIGKIEPTKIKIDKNNFIPIYNRWLETVKPSIRMNWDKAKKDRIIDGDFYLADLLSNENKTLIEKLSVVLNVTKYVLVGEETEYGMFTFGEVGFSDGQKAHSQFWAKYERPPLKEYWDYIIERRDLIVPQDIRERKGSFFTPKIWVELSQIYIAKVFGENWQDEYYVWDCAAGTGNLLAGLTNKYNIWASTIDEADVDVMHERIKNGANLLKDHCFQFDFLNDDFSNLPKDLQDIVKNEPEKLIIYINPPYAEAGSKKTQENKSGVATSNATYEKYKDVMGKATNEIFAMFLIRAYMEAQRCKIANFATLKALCAFNFAAFRKIFKAKLERLFIIPADTFDNVEGQFPIGFHIWDTDKKEIFKEITANIYDRKGFFAGVKTFYSYDDNRRINDWTTAHKADANIIGYIYPGRNDFQHTNLCYICSIIMSETDNRFKGINANNLIHSCIYLSVQKVIPADWKNDRDQFLYPNDDWIDDEEFQNNCLAYTLFHNSNNISSKYGINHWIPFTEYEVNSHEKFAEHFMTDFIAGKIKTPKGNDMFGVRANNHLPLQKRTFSTESENVFNAGRELWRYYHSQPKVDVNASFYDIREYFQGRNEKGRMNNKSNDEIYNKLLADLRTEMNILAGRIKLRVYKYGFLKEQPTHYIPSVREDIDTTSPSYDDYLSYDSQVLALEQAMDLAEA